MQSKRCRLSMGRTSCTALWYVHAALSAKIFVFAVLSVVRTWFCCCCARVLHLLCVALSLLLCMLAACANPCANLDARSHHGEPQLGTLMQSEPALLYLWLQQQPSATRQAVGLKNWESALSLLLLSLLLLPSPPPGLRGVAVVVVAIA